MPARRALSPSARINRRESRNETFESRINANPSATVCVAEGDSWFDYLPAWIDSPSEGDLLARLEKTKRYVIYRVSQAGDTLDNMVYGTDYNNRWKEKPSQIDETLKAIRKWDPAVFLFSGGGNDLSGVELESLLNHRDAGLTEFRNEVVDYVFEVSMPKAYNDLIARVTAEKPDIKIFLHGYGYADPTGKGVGRLPFNWSFIGPWLLPALAKKRYRDETSARSIIRALIDRFNDMLTLIASGHPNVFHINLCSKLKYDHWANELHLNGNGWAIAAKEFDDAIRNNL